MRNIKILLEYDGTDFYGWQWQPECRTVQGELESSLKQLFQKTSRIQGAGRTDSGVHALGQVANFKTESKLGLQQIKDGLNSYLSRDVRILDAQEVTDNFQSRFDAKARTYRYVIAKIQKAIGRQYSWFCKYDLDVSKMQQACKFLIGSHSFEAFSKFNEDEPHYLCNVENAFWVEENSSLIFEIKANRFLHNMVRILVGSMIEVGRDKIKPKKVQEILESKNRKNAGCKVPAQGLVLVNVQY